MSCLPSAGASQPSSRSVGPAWGSCPSARTFPPASASWGSAPLSDLKLQSEMLPRLRNVRTL